MVASAVDAKPGTLMSVRPPDTWRLLLEQRVGFELGALIAASPALGLLGKGDRHPVLVLPGFTAGDASTQPLRRALRSWGYWAHGWRLGRNLGPTTSVVDGLAERLDQVYDRHDTKVSLIGWSLGGIYAREMARRHPDRIRSVITMGSPFRMVEGDRSTVSTLADRVAPSLNDEIGHLMRMSIAEADKPPVPVPTTAIYSRSDGVVRWHTCIDTVDELHENVEVRGSHSGLGFNPTVLYVIADRLMQPADDWHSFRPPRHLRSMYPRPVSWEQANRRAHRS